MAIVANNMGDLKTAATDVVDLLFPIPAFVASEVSQDLKAPSAPQQPPSLFGGSSSGSIVGETTSNLFFLVGVFAVMGGAGWLAYRYIKKKGRRRGRR